MTRLYEDDAELYDIAFDWDISAEADWLVETSAATAISSPAAAPGGCSRLLRIEAVKSSASGTQLRVEWADEELDLVSGTSGSDPASRFCQGRAPARSSRSCTR